METIYTLLSKLRAAVSSVLHGMSARELIGDEREEALRLFG